VIGPDKVDYLKGEHLGVVVACIFEGDIESNLPKGDGLLARDHSVEWVRAIFELVPGQSSPSKMLRPLPPSMRALVSQVVPTSGSTMRGNLPCLGIQSR
jgi:hypothetical protein